tara:strand:+ start:789 stop:1133 length:345 start_codon:yes stop_codon:yes gene_type:complete
LGNSPLAFKFKKARKFAAATRLVHTALKSDFGRRSSFDTALILGEYFCAFPPLPTLNIAPLNPLGDCPYRKWAAKQPLAVCSLTRRLNHSIFTVAGSFFSRTQSLGKCGWPPQR